MAIPLAHLEIRSLPSNGTLTLGGSTVLIGTTVTQAQLDAGDLVFTPVANANGAGYDSFQFRVNDGGLNSIDYTATFNVDPVNDLPTQFQSIHLPSMKALPRP